MHRKLGTRGPEVSALGFGCMGLNYGLRSRSRQAGGDFTDPASIRERRDVL